MDGQAVAFAIEENVNDNPMDQQIIGEVVAADEVEINEELIDDQEGMVYDQLSVDEQVYPEQEFDNERDDSESNEEEQSDEDDENHIPPFLSNNPERLAMPLLNKDHLTVWDHLIAIIAMSVRFNMPYENTLSMFKWINSTLVEPSLPTHKAAL